MAERGRRAAIFDLDGTLIGLPSSERRFIGELWAERRIDWRRAGLFALFPLVWLPPVCHPLGAAKARLAAQACLARGLDLAAATAYGDSALDLPLLLRVADPIAVSPDRALRRAARSRSWPVLDP